MPPSKLKSQILILLDRYQILYLLRRDTAYSNISYDVS
jgi:hypothetical protein